MTSILVVTMLCRACGTELCPDCFKGLENYPQQSRRLLCHEKQRHSADHFIAVSRLSNDEFESIITEMQVVMQIDGGMPEEDLQIADTKNVDRIDAEVCATKSIIPTCQRGDSAPTNNARGLSSLSVKESPSSLTPLVSHLFPSKHDHSLVNSPDDRVLHASLRSHAQTQEHNLDQSRVPRLPYHKFHHASIDPEMFAVAWSRGEALVITGLDEKFTLPWTPEWFILNHGDDPCDITDCVQQSSTQSTVAGFFRVFENPQQGTMAKLKVCLQHLQSHTFMLLMITQSIGLASTS